MNFFQELKRRNVFRVGIAYGVAAWVLLQVADLVLEAIEAPSWVLQVLMLLIGLGFIAAIVVAWASLSRSKRYASSTARIADSALKEPFAENAS